MSCQSYRLSQNRVSSQAGLLVGDRVCVCVREREGVFVCVCVNVYMVFLVVLAFVIPVSNKSILWSDMHR